MSLHGETPRIDESAPTTRVETCEGKIRVLVVDDAPAMREAVCCVLGLHNAIEVVGQAQNGVEAIEAVAGLQPDLVLMDVCMPRMNGLQATGILREHFPQVWVVLMTGDPAPELREQSLASGADAFIFKTGFAAEFMALLQDFFPGLNRCFTS